MTGQNRYRSIDMARGIGITLVLFGHLEVTEPHILLWISSFHMAMFFVLSGITLSLSREARNDTKARMLKKVRTIIIPYIWFSVFYVCMDVLNLQLGKIDAPTFRFNAVSLATFYGKSVLWFMTALFISHTALIVLQRIVPEKQDALVLAASVVIGALSCVAAEALVKLTDAGTLSFAQTTLVNMGKSVARAGVVLPFVTAGYYGRIFFASRPDLLRGKGARWFLALATGVACYAVAEYRGMIDTNNLVIGNPALYYLAGFLGSISIIALCTLLPDIPVLRRLGSYSFVIMAVHLDLYVLWMGLQVGMRMYGFFPYRPVLTVTTVAVALAIGSLIAYVIERWFPFLLGRKKPA